MTGFRGRYGQGVTAWMRWPSYSAISSRPAGIHGDRLRVLQPCLRRRAALAEAGAAPVVPGDDVDVARGYLLAVEAAGPHGDQAHHAFDRVEDLDVAVAVDGDAVGSGERPGDGVDVAGLHLDAVEPARPRGDHADPVVAGQHQVPGRVHRRAKGLHGGAGRGHAVGDGRSAAAGADAVTGHGVDVPGFHLDAEQRARVGRDVPRPGCLGSRSRRRCRR